VKFLISVRAGHCDYWSGVPENPRNATTCAWRLHRSCRTGFRPNVLLLSRAAGHNILCFSSHNPDPNVIEAIWALLQQCETHRQIAFSTKEKKRTVCVKICVVQWKQMPLLEEKYILLLLFLVKYLYRMSLKRLKNMASD